MTTLCGGSGLVCVYRGVAEVDDRFRLGQYYGGRRKIRQAGLEVGDLVQKFPFANLPFLLRGKDLFGLSGVQDSDSRFCRRDVVLGSGQGRESLTSSIREVESLNVSHTLQCQGGLKGFQTELKVIFVTRTLGVRRRLSAEGWGCRAAIEGKGWRNSIGPGLSV